MTHRLTTNYAKNYCNRTPIVKVIVENVLTCFFLGGGHGVQIYVLLTHLQTNAPIKTNKLSMHNKLLLSRKRLILTVCRGRTEAL